MINEKMKQAEQERDRKERERQEQDNRPCTKCGRAGHTAGSCIYKGPGR